MKKLLFNQDKILLLISKFICKDKRGTESTEDFDKHISYLIIKELRKLAGSYNLRLEILHYEETLHKLLANFLTDRWEIEILINQLYSYFKKV